jgi:hypothetical protein
VELWSASPTSGGGVLLDQQSIVILTNGKNSISTLLTNESAVVSAAFDGGVTPAELAKCGGTFKVYDGTTEVTTNCAFSVGTIAPAGSVTTTINPTSGVYGITGLTADTATVKYRADYNGTIYEKLYSIAKSKNGAAIVLSASKQTFTATDNVMDTGQGAITFTATFNAGLGTPSWTTSPTVTLGGGANDPTRTLSAADFGANREVTVTCTVGSFSDKITVIRIEKSTAAANATKNTAFSQATRPTGPSAGDTWFNTSTVLVEGLYKPNTLYAWDGSSWLQAGPTGTLISQTGIYTGSINADNITSGTISGRTISGGTITGGTINGTNIIAGTLSAQNIVNTGNIVANAVTYIKSSQQAANSTLIRSSASISDWGLPASPAWIDTTTTTPFSTDTNTPVMVILDIFGSAVSGGSGGGGGTHSGVGGIYDTRLSVRLIRRTSSNVETLVWGPYTVADTNLVTDPDPNNNLLYPTGLKNLRAMFVDTITTASLVNLNYVLQWYPSCFITSTGGSNWAGTATLSSSTTMFTFGAKR